MPKVSVIIPVYGVERYIERCAESLFLQTLDDIEYIFVDDCTPDNSIELLKRIITKYPNRQNQIRIERMSHNSGLPAARAYGLKLATADYIAHCDSDDWVDLKMYEQLYDKAIREKSDLVLCDYYISDDHNTRYFSKKVKDTSRDVILSRLLTEYSLNPVWSVMAHRRLYDMIKTPKGNQGEDNTFMIQLAYKAQKISYLSEALYYYRITPNSISNSIDIQSIMKRYNQLCLNREIVREFAENQGFINDYRAAFEAYFFRTKNILNDYLYDTSCRELWLSSYKISLLKVFFNKYISLREILNYCRIKLILHCKS